MTKPFHYEGPGEEFRDAATEAGLIAPTSDQTERLRECPFCGGQAEFVRRGDSRQSCIVACTNCGARHESADTWNSGKSWNRRVPAEQGVEKDFGDIVHFAFRYALGRQTYAPVFVADYIKANADRIEAGQLAQMAREIREWEANDNPLRMRMDVEGWREFREWIEAGIHPPIAAEEEKAE